MMWNHKLQKLIVSLLLFGMQGLYSLYGQTVTESLSGHYSHETYQIHFYIDLTGDGVEVPGYSFLGKMRGYIDGRINGKWFLTSYKEEDSYIRMRFSNDQGSDTQELRTEVNNDSVITIHLEGHNYLRRIEKRKYVKLPQVLQLKKIHNK